LVDPGDPVAGRAKVANDAPAFALTARGKLIVRDAVCAPDPRLTVH
jgi:hypothetical protein